jgi:uncharacterized protein (TIGR01777 family)
MRVFITGATGFIGRALVPLLRRQGHEVVVWARSPQRARARLGAEVEIVDVASGGDGLAAALADADAVVNLAGEPIVDARWTANRRRVLRDSRVALTREIVAALPVSGGRPRVLVSASAVGYYGDRGSDVLDETAKPGSDFLAGLCQEWEAAAQHAEAFGVRVATIRTGVVLGREGGALARMLPPFRLGLGGPVASGRQYVPWIHLHDLVAIMAAAIADERYRGPINAVAPAPVTSREFARALGTALRRPALLPVPSLALRAIFGEAAQVLTGSQRVDPAALRRLGFAFAFPTIDAALADIVRGTPVAVVPLSRPVDAGGSSAARRYLERQPPTYELRTRTVVPAPVEETFAFFSKAENLGMLTPSSMQFSIDGRPPAVGEDTSISYRLRVGVLPIAWRSRIVNWRPGARFVDLQERGPYRSWWHEHAFHAEGSSTVMEDRVCYAPPFSVIGRLANRLFIAPMLRRIFQYRADVIRLRFGAPA